MSDEQPLTSRRAHSSPATLVPVDVLAGWLLFGVSFLVAQLYPQSPLRTVLAAPVLFFLPGYLTVAAALPHDASAPESAYPTRISVGERVALSFGLSIVLLPILGLVVAALPWGFSQVTLGATLGSYVLVVGAVAGLRHLRLPAEHRFHVPLGRWADGLSRSLHRGSAVERVVTLALVLSVLLAVGAAGYALAVPNDGETYTDLHLVTTDGDEAVAADYPTELTRGEAATYTVGVENRENQPMDYQVVVTLDRVVESDGRQLVIESDEQARLDASVAAGEEWTETHTVEPALTGEDLRLTYHLYVGDAPEHVDTSEAYRQVHLWVDVADAA